MYSIFNTVRITKDIVNNNTLNHNTTTNVLFLKYSYNFRLFFLYHK